MATATSAASADSRAAIGSSTSTGVSPTITRTLTSLPKATAAAACSVSLYLSRTHWAWKSVGATKVTPSSVLRQNVPVDAPFARGSSSAAAVGSVHRHLDHVAETHALVRHTARRYQKAVLHPGGDVADRSGEIEEGQDDQDAEDNEDETPDVIGLAAHPLPQPFPHPSQRAEEPGAGTALGVAGPTPPLTPTGLSP